MKYLIAQAIDFDKLREAIPGLKIIFKPGLSGMGPLVPGDTRSTAGKVGQIISAILPFLFVIAGLMLLFYLIAGGFQMMTAANDEKGLVEAKGKITNALIGFVLLFVSYWLAKMLGYILGISIL